MTVSHDDVPTDDIDRTGRPSKHRTGMISGYALGAVMLVVALVVAALSGSTETDDQEQVSATGGGTQTVEVTLGDMDIKPALIEVEPGTRLILEVVNADTMEHDLALESGQQTPMLAGGESATLDVGVVEAGIEGWCTVPGHRAAGMSMTIVTTDGGAAADGGDDADSADGAQSGHDMGGMSAQEGEPATIDFGATPEPDWQPYDPTLEPAPGGTEHEVTMTVSDTLTEVAPGVNQTLWTFNGTAPGPTLRGNVGDVFTITFVNDATMGHGIDFHAGSLAPDRPMRTIAPGEKLTYQFTANNSGAWLYHCSTMPMSLHIANGMYGAVIIDPPNLPEVDTELILVRSELYLGPEGGIANEASITAREPDASVFNGYVNQYSYEPIRVPAGERIRVWIVDAGPQQSTAFHVVGAQFDTVFKEGAYQVQPGNAEHGASQVIDLVPGQGGFVEFVLPEPGHYPIMDHYMVDGESGAHGMFEAY